jgi:hypothetical protein
LKNRAHFKRFAISEKTSIKLQDTLNLFVFAIVPSMVVPGIANIFIVGNKYMQNK